MGRRLFLLAAAGQQQGAEGQEAGDAGGVIHGARSFDLGCGAGSPRSSHRCGLVRLGGLFGAGDLHLLAGVQQLAAGDHHPLARLQALAHQHLAAGVANRADLLQRHPLVITDQPHRRLAPGLGQRRPGQHDAIARAQAGGDHGAQVHLWRHVLQRHLDLEGAALRVDGRGDLAHLALGGHLRLAEEGDGHVLALQLLVEQRFVDVEHGVTLALAGEGEDRHRGLHHLADFGVAAGDHAVGRGLQLGIGEHVAGVCGLGLGGVQGAAGGTQLGLCLVELAPAGVALGQQLALALEGQLGLPSCARWAVTAALAVSRLLRCSCGSRRASTCCAWTWSPTSTRRSMILPPTRKACWASTRAWMSPVRRTSALKSASSMFCTRTRCTGLGVSCPGRRPTAVRPGGRLRCERSSMRGMQRVHP